MKKGTRTLGQAKTAETNANLGYLRCSGIPGEGGEVGKPKLTTDDTDRKGTAKLRFGRPFENV
jgi:hypothetical protein